MWSFICDLDQGWSGHLFYLGDVKHAIISVRLRIRRSVVVYESADIQYSKINNCVESADI